MDDRTAFLQNTLYPSILESSVSDGTGTAILSYLEALFSLLEVDGRLTGSVLAFLSGHDAPAASEAGEAASHPMAARVSSSGLRYTLRDLLLAHLQPALQSSVPEQSKGHKSGTLPIRVLHLILSKFDAFALELFDIVPDLLATKFPFDASVLTHNAGSTKLDTSAAGAPEEDETFQYPGTDEADSEAESFVYPSPDRPDRTGRAHVQQITAAAGINDVERYSGPSELELLLRLIPSAEKADADYGSHVRLSTPSSSFLDVFLSLTGSTSHTSYLKDAEAAIVADISFRRGSRVAASYESKSSNATSVDDYSPPSRASPPSTGGGPSPLLAAGEDTNDTTGLFDPMTPHRLFTGSIMLRRLLNHLARLFVNPPALNLVVTSVMYKLAICPYRSLEGWLLPSSTPLRKLGEAGLLPIDYAKLLTTNANEPPPFAAGKRPFEMLQAGPASNDKAMGVAGSIFQPEEAAVFSMLDRLLLLLARYRREIRSFDKHLKERRDGMLFVEDLAEAIGGSAPAPAAEHKDDNQSRPGMLPRSGSTGFGSQVALALTPNRPKKGSMTGSSLSGRQQAEQDPRSTAQSPYAAHMAQTSEIRVQAYTLPSSSNEDDDSHAETPASWKSPKTMSEASSEEVPETPTGPTRPAIKPARGQMQSQMVSLSMLLDNVIILEEAVKELVAVVVVRKSLGIDSV